MELDLLELAAFQVEHEPGRIAKGILATVSEQLEIDVAQIVVRDGSTVIVVQATDAPCTLRLPTSAPPESTAALAALFDAPGQEWNKTRFMILSPWLTSLRYSPAEECVWGHFTRSLVTLGTSPAVTERFLMSALAFGTPPHIQT